MPRQIQGDRTPASIAKGLRGAAPGMARLPPAMQQQHRRRTHRPIHVGDKNAIVQAGKLSSLEDIHARACRGRTLSTCSEVFHG